MKKSYNQRKEYDMTYWGEKNYIEINDITDLLNMLSESVKELADELHFGGELSSNSYVDGAGFRKTSTTELVLKGVAQALDGYCDTIRYSPLARSRSAIISESDEDMEVNGVKSAESSE